MENRVLAFQAILMFVAIVVTIGTYLLNRRHDRKNLARKILTEFENSIEIVREIRKIVGDEGHFGIEGLLIIDLVGANTWEREGSLIYRKLTISEHRTINAFFKKMGHLSNMLDILRSSVIEQYSDFYVTCSHKIAWEELDRRRIPNAVSIRYAKQITQVIPVLCRDLEILSESFPNERLEKIEKWIR